MLKTLHGKLSVALLALLSLLGVLYVSLTLYTTRTYVNEVNQNLNRALASDLAKHLINQNLLRPNPESQRLTEAEIKQSMVLNPDIEIYILDSNGKIMAYSAAPGAVQLQQVSLEPIQRFLAALGPLPILGDDPRHPNRQKIFSASRIPPDGTGKIKDRLKGYIYIILGGEKYDTVAASPNRSYIWRLSLWSTIGSLSFVALAGVLLFGFLTRRLRRLMHLLDEFQTQVPGVSEPESAHQSRLAASDEISRLETAFGRMSERILMQIKQREEADAMRREAVTNVSHDLRTPLAALQGYLETLLMKEGTLTPQEQREYLLTAAKHSERLSKLIAALFELAKLDSREMQPALEDFSLAELAQDVAQQHALSAQSKGVRLEAELPEDLPPVRADIGLIERVLQNLLENALRHTPSGGLITVSLRRESTREGSHIIVQVADNGEGIAPEDLPRIFDRSFRASSTRGDDGGAGLGLAITRRIAQLHGSDIEVQSTRGEGTTFSFTLPISPQTS
jgi:two-component system OmpR family sensor kinase